MIKNENLKRYINYLKKKLKALTLINTTKTMKTITLLTALLAVFAINNIHQPINTNWLTPLCENLVITNIQEAYKQWCKVELIEANMLEIKSWREPLY